MSVNNIILIALSLLLLGIVVKFFLYELIKESITRTKQKNISFTIEQKDKIAEYNRYLRSKLINKDHLRDYQKTNVSVPVDQIEAFLKRYLELNFVQALIIEICDLKVVTTQNPNLYGPRRAYESKSKHLFDYLHGELQRRFGYSYRPRKLTLKDVHLCTHKPFDLCLKKCNKKIYLEWLKGFAKARDKFENCDSEHDLNTIYIAQCDMVLDGPIVDVDYVIAPIGITVIRNGEDSPHVLDMAINHTSEVYHPLTEWDAKQLDKAYIERS